MANRHNRVGVLPFLRSFCARGGVGLDTNVPSKLEVVSCFLQIFAVELSKQRQ